VQLKGEGLTLLFGPTDWISPAVRGSSADSFRLVVQRLWRLHCRSWNMSDWREVYKSHMSAVFLGSCWWPGSSLKVQCSAHNHRMVCVYVCVCGVVLVQFALFSLVCNWQYCTTFFAHCSWKSWRTHRNNFGLNCCAVWACMNSVLRVWARLMCCRYHFAKDVERYSLPTVISCFRNLFVFRRKEYMLMVIPTTYDLFPSICFICFTVLKQNTVYFSPLMPCLVIRSECHFV